MNFSNELKYINFSFCMGDLTDEHFISIKEGFSNLISKNMRLDSLYLYEIYTNEGNPLTKDGIPFGSMLFKFDNDFILKTIDNYLKAKYISMTDNEYKHGLISNFYQKIVDEYYNIESRDKITELTYEKEILYDLFDLHNANLIWDLKMEIAMKIEESDLVKEIKSIFSSLRYNEYINLSLGYLKL